ncbi:TPM domain-containing protein, partial [Streptococcus infantis]|nr:TPM domain-containing protein [Streptococcus infantis]
MMKKLSLILASLITALLFLIGSVRADIVIPDRPSNGIYDPNHYLSSVVSDRLRELNSKSDTQIAIYIVDSLEGESLEKSANTIARSWKIGYSDSNKGALLLIAIKDRKFRIETSNHLAATLTDAKTKKILDASRDKMRAKDYDGAVIDIIESISSHEYSISTVPIEKNNPLLGFVKKAWRKVESGIIWVGIISIVTLLISAFVYLSDFFMYGTSSNRKRKSNKMYEGSDKLYPYDTAFLNDGSWSQKEFPNCQVKCNKVVPLIKRVSFKLFEL